MGYTIHSYTPSPKLQHNNLEKLGFKYIENLEVYHARFSDSYYSDLIEVKVVGNTASILMTDMDSVWCRQMARKAITALSKQKEYPDSTGFYVGVEHDTI